MAARIAIPLPHSTDREYGDRAIPQYEHAIRLAGGEPVRIPLHEQAAGRDELIASCQAVLLPGSKADVNPEKFRQERSTHTAPADPRREAIDFLLLDHAYAERKPVLGICYGLQSLNVFRSGSLVQHIPDFLSEDTRAKVNHEAGRKIAVAHQVEIEPGSRLGVIVARGKNREGNDLPRARRAAAEPGGALVIPVNSSHHQSVQAVGEDLRMVARCPPDGIIEALEGVAPDHFVLAVQWHPERSVQDDPASRSIFEALIEAANQRRDRT
jgi:putative glutamine amidotransferase